MQKLVKEYLDELSRRQKKERKIAVAVMLLVVIVVGTVAGILTQYGVAMTGKPRCGLEEHTHGENHTHTEACDTVPEEFICGLEESEGHTHTDSCYTLPEEYICGLKEQQSHAHGEDCYTEELTYRRRYGDHAVSDADDGIRRSASDGRNYHASPAAGGRSGRRKGAVV